MTPRILVNNIMEQLAISLFSAWIIVLIVSIIPMPMGM